ncbi:MAG: SDR family oxidoreductase [Phycisphaeraceae bacterium]
MRVLLTGASGQLGGYLMRELQERGEQVFAWSGRRDVDLTDGSAVRQAFERAQPDVVLHTAAMSKPTDCHAHPDQAQRVNVVATERLTELADAAGARMIFTSTDLVFDGEEGMYREEDTPKPMSVYGRTKLEAEHVVLGSQRAMVARLSLLFGPGVTGVRTLFDEQVATMRAGKPVRLFSDEWRTPLALPLAAEALADACSSDASGLFHLGGGERVSRLEMGRLMAQTLGADPSCLSPCSRLTVSSDEPRPCDASLRTERWRETFGPAVGAELKPVIASLI